MSKNFGEVLILVAGDHHQLHALNGFVCSFCFSQYCLQKIGVDMYLCMCSYFSTLWQLHLVRLMGISEYAVMVVSINSVVQFVFFLLNHKL